MTPEHAMTERSRSLLIRCPFAKVYGTRCLFSCWIACVLSKLHHTERKIFSNLLKRKQSNKKLSIVCHRLKCAPKCSQSIYYFSIKAKEFIDAFRFMQCAHLSIVYVTYTIDECAHMRKTECTYWLIVPTPATRQLRCCVLCSTGLEA